MRDDAYYKLAKVLGALPSGFPSTKSGTEIEILKKIFTPEEADLFSDLRLTYESAAQIAKRTGRPLQGLEEQLTSMWQRGEVQSYRSRSGRVFRMVPWSLGSWEVQQYPVDREAASLCLLSRFQHA